MDPHDLEPRVPSPAAADGQGCVLVVANETLASPELYATVLADRDAKGFALHLLVPATHAPELHAALARSEHLPASGGEDVDYAVAEWRLRQGLRRCHEAGFTADGSVGPADPVRAAARAVSTNRIDEVIVSTLPSRVSRWLAMDVPSRMRRRVAVPVTHVESARPAHRADTPRWTLSDAWRARPPGHARDGRPTAPGTRFERGVYAEVRERDERGARSRR